MRKQSKEFTNDWILEQAKKQGLKVGYVQIGKCDDPNVIDEYIHLVKNKDGVEK